MKRASYRFGVAWIALNDDAGTDPPGNPDAESNVSGYISTALLADLFGVTTERVAKDVMRVRREVDKASRLELGATVVGRIL